MTRYLPVTESVAFLPAESDLSAKTKDKNKVQNLGLH